MFDLLAADQSSLVQSGHGDSPIHLSNSTTNDNKPEMVGPQVHKIIDEIQHLFNQSVW